MPQDRRRKEDEQPHCLLPRINVTLCGAAARGERSYSDQREEQKLQTFRTQEEIDLRDQSHKYLFLSSYIAETALLFRFFSTGCSAWFVLFSSIQLELEAAVLLQHIRTATECDLKQVLYLGPSMVVHFFFLYLALDFVVYFANLLFIKFI